MFRRAGACWGRSVTVTAVSIHLSAAPGQIAPLELLPGPLRAVATALPFRWMVGFPVELILGRLTPRDALVGLAAQAIWLALAYGLFRLVWRGPPEAVHQPPPGG